MRKVLSAAVLFVLLSLLFAGCEQKKIDTAKLTGQEVFEMKCSHCHDLPAMSTYKGDDWIPTVMRMQAKNPSWIDDNEAKKIQEYLSSTSKTK